MAKHKGSAIRQKNDQRKGFIKRIKKAGMVTGSLYLVFILVKKEVILCWIIGPDVFNAIINITFILNFL